MFGPNDDDYTQEFDKCEGCGRSVLSRFGGEASYVCESCEADATKEWEKGIEIGGVLYKTEKGTQ